MLDQEVFENLEDLIQDIRLKSSEGALILVEGKNDVNSLRELGVNGSIRQIPEGGKTVLHSLENFSNYDEIIVLTDFDREGEKLNSFCEKQLSKLGITVLSDLRKRLKKYVIKAVKDIEGLSTFLEAERASRMDKESIKNS
ncbi:MAG: toprim domain-containing protein [Candidatus Hadarchaeia archaeon]